MSISRNFGRAEYPVRIRLEWLIATARVVMAGSAVATYAIYPFGPSLAPGGAAALVSYFVYSLLVLAVVWAPVRFGRGSDLAAHVLDLVAFVVLLLVTGAAASPFYNYIIFLVICATLRWGPRGALWTAFVAIAIYVGVSWRADVVTHVHTFPWNTVVIRTVNVAVVATLAGYVATYQQRHDREVSRLVSWPTGIPRNAQTLAAEILAESSSILDSPRVLLAWQERDGEALNLAWRSRDGELHCVEDATITVASLVDRGLQGKSFCAANAMDDRGVVIRWHDGTFKQRRCAPIPADIRSRFSMREVLTWPVDGELVHGRLFCLDKRQARVDHLVFGLVVARQAAARLDNLYLLQRLRAAARLEERLRLARDLHDSTLQSVAGCAMQLLAARRLLDRDPARARLSLESVQTHLETCALETRTVITGLRPSDATALADLGRRLDELRAWVKTQWNIDLALQMDESDRWPPGVAVEVYRIVQEGVLNAARHAGASKVSVALAIDGQTLRISIIDDGHGFPFKGTYSLDELNETERGPLTLRERVTALDGDLVLRSMESGADLRIGVPLPTLAG